MHLTTQHIDSGRQESVDFKGRSIALDCDPAGNLSVGGPTDYPLRIDFNGRIVTITDLGSTRRISLAGVKLSPGVPHVWPPEQALQIERVLISQANPARKARRRWLIPTSVWRSVLPGVGVLTVGVVLSMLVLLAMRAQQRRILAAPLAATATSTVTPTPTSTVTATPTATLTATPTPPALPVALNPNDAVLTPTVVGAGQTDGGVLSSQEETYDTIPRPDYWDARLSILGVDVQPARVAEGKAYWRLMEARWWDETESRGNHHIFVEVLDEQGHRIVNQQVRMAWPDGECIRLTEDKPSPEYAANCPMYATGYSYDVRVDGLPSESVHRLGLGTLLHREAVTLTSFVLKFQRTVYTKPE